MAEVSLPAPVGAVVEAINSADTDAFVAAFTTDGYVDDWGRVLRGPEGIRSWAGTDAIGVNAQMTVLTASTDGDTTRVHFEWRSNRFNGESDGIFVVSGDKVASFTIPPHR
jgi:hypothetical protein